MGEDGVRWISARDAADLLAKSQGGPPAAKAIIADALRDGRLSARAEKQWRGPSRKFEFVDGSRGVVSLASEISSSEWQSSTRWGEDVDSWNWVAGRFSVARAGFKATSVGGLGPKYTMFLGLEFFRDEILALGLTTEKPRTKRRGGVKPAFERWESLYREVIKLAQARKLNEATFPNVTNLHDHLLLHTGLASETIEPRVSEIWNDFVAVSRAD